MLRPAAFENTSFGLETLSVIFTIFLTTEQTLNEDSRSFEKKIIVCCSLMGIFQKLTHNNLVQIISIKNPHKLKDVSSLNSAQIKMSV